MATDTRNQMGKPDNRAALWVALALIAFAILAYAGYAAYYRPNNYTQTPATPGPVTSPNQPERLQQ